MARRRRYSAEFKRPVLKHSLKRLFIYSRGFGFFIFQFVNWARFCLTKMVDSRQMRERKGVLPSGEGAYSGFKTMP